MTVQSVQKKLVKSLKKRLACRLPWNFKKSMHQQSYEELPAADPHQEEVDDNALNEALEARLMELIASAPAQEVPVTFHISTGLPIVPANPDLFAFGTFWIPDNFPTIQTRCQSAECQTA